MQLLQHSPFENVPLPVSYTHLDVYKRQEDQWSSFGRITSKNTCLQLSSVTFGKYSPSNVTAIPPWHFPWQKEAFSFNLSWSACSLIRLSKVFTTWYEPFKWQELPTQTVTSFNQSTSCSICIHHNSVRWQNRVLFSFGKFQYAFILLSPSAIQSKQNIGNLWISLLYYILRCLTIFNIG